MASLEKDARNKPSSERKLHSLKDIIAMEELKKDTSITKGVLTTARSILETEDGEENKKCFKQLIDSHLPKWCNQ